MTGHFAIFRPAGRNVPHEKSTHSDFKGDPHGLFDRDDESILTNIDRLVKEEEHLYGKSEITSEDRARLAELKVHLDQCWDLLRQRRALREFGKDPDSAKVRPAKIVENYEQ